MMFAGYFNMNVLDYEYNRKIKKSFFDLIYQRNLITTINKRTMVGIDSATAIDHIIMNYVLRTNFTDYFQSFGMKTTISQLGLHTDF